jgi:hypothetical protein
MAGCLLFCNRRLEISGDGLMFNLQGAAEHSRGSMGWILSNSFYYRFSETNALSSKIIARMPLKLSNIFLLFRRLNKFYTKGSQISTQIIEF